MSVSLSSPLAIPPTSIPPLSLLQTKPKGHCHIPSWTVGAAAESVASIKHGTVFGGDRSRDWLYGWRDQPSPQRIHARTQTSTHTIHSHTYTHPHTPPVPAAILRPLPRCQAEALDLPLLVILHGKEVQPNVLAGQPGKQTTTHTHKHS